MANFPTISADTIASVGDPWVAEMQKREVENTLSSLPRGPNGQVDYGQAALKMMSVNPVAATQLMKMAQISSENAYRSRSLDIQASAENKPQIHEDPNTGDQFILRPSTLEGRWLSGPNAGQAINLGGPLSTRPGARGMPPAGPPRSAAPAPELPTRPAPAAAPPPTSQQPQEITLPSGATVSADEGDLLRQHPEKAAAFDKAYGPGSAAAILGNAPGRRSEADTGQGGIGSAIAFSPAVGGGGELSGGQGQPSDTAPIALAQNSPQTLNTNQQQLRAAGEAEIRRRGMGQLEANQPPVSLYGEPTGKQEREAAKSYFTEAGKKSADEQLKLRENAYTASKFVPDVIHLENAFNKLDRAGVVEPILQNPIAQFAGKYGTNIYKMLGGQPQDASSPSYDPSQRNILGRVADTQGLVSDYQYELSRVKVYLQREMMAGLGSMSNLDAKSVELALPQLDNSDPRVVRRAIGEIKQALLNTMQRGGIRPPPPPRTEAQ